jgi:hypothetical protein
MNPTIKNVLAVVAGLVLGSIVNMAIIMISGSIIPPPEGADVTSMEGLKASMHLFGPKNFIFPFLAHALGTWVGAIIAAKFAANKNMRLAMVIGAIFFVGGFTNVFLLPSPMWFNILDLVGAYFPMAYLGGKLMVKG